MHAIQIALSIGLTLVSANIRGASIAPIRVIKPDGTIGPVTGCFGSSVALSGSIAFAGDPCETGKGAVYRLRRHGAGWVVDLRIGAPVDMPINGAFGASLAINGKVLGIGAPGAEGGGAVYEVANISADSPDAPQSNAPPVPGQARFGTAVAYFSNPTLWARFMASAPGGSCPGATHAGFASPVPQGVQTFACAPGQRDWTEFGHALKTSPGFILIGAPSITPPTGTQGAGYLYSMGDPFFNPPTVVSIFIPTDPDADRRFGSSLDMAGSTIVFGAPNDSPWKFGNVWIYEGSVPDWRLSAILHEPDPRSGGRLFGSSVALGADTLWVGSPLSNEGGSVYQYARTANDWVFVDRFDAAPIDAGGSLGFSLALDHATWIAGAPAANFFAPQDASGAIYISASDYLFEDGFDR